MSRARREALDGGAAPWSTLEPAIRHWRPEWMAASLGFLWLAVFVGPASSWSRVGAIGTIVLVTLVVSPG